MNLLVKNIGELVTMAPLVDDRRNTEITKADLGIVTNAWMAVERGKVVGFGSGEPPKDYQDKETVDAQGGLVMPGLVDAHTHPLFAGNRAAEFAQRLDGVSYQKIAEQGGGIQSTVKATQAASDQELLSLTSRRLKNFLKRGITTLEAKSGYGLSTEEELRHLRVLNQAKEQTKQEVSITCLALHAHCPDYASRQEHADAITAQLLKVVASEELADSVDAFIEDGYFTVAEVQDYVAKAKRLGLSVRIHADEFSDAGAATAAADWGASSADHLQHASDAAILRMAEAGTVAIVLPGTSLFTAIPFTNARRFLDQGCPVAIASDYNPGSSNIDNLAQLATVAALHCGFKSAEAIAAVTWVAATSLQRMHKGALAKFSDADFLIYDGIHTADEWLYDFGKAEPAVFIRGEKQ